MEKRRHVEKALSIFQLTIRDALCLHETVKTGIMMLYDRASNHREFTVLNRSIPSELSGRIVSWLEQQTDVDDILWGLKSNKMDADQAASHKRGC
ncbi:MAG: hypothetical protein JXL84_17490 [Deltaproteobacteria bacterium]|nr:hypothetical protein [Deltaproteobacteria bacterium]